MPKILVKIVYLNLILILWTPIIVSPETVYPFVISKAFYSRILIEFAVALWLSLAILDSRYRPRRSKILFAIAIYFTLAVLATIAGANPYFSFWSDLERMNGLWDLAHWLMLIVVLVSVLQVERQWKNILCWNLVVVLCVSIVGLFQVWNISIVPMLIPTGIVTDCRIYGTLGNASYLAAILMINIFVALGLLSWANSSSGITSSTKSVGPGFKRLNHGHATTSLWFNGLCIATVMLGTICLLYTGTRASIYALILVVIGLLITMILFRDIRRYKSLAISLTALLGFIAFTFVIDVSVGLPLPQHCSDDSTGFRLLSSDGYGEVPGSSTESNTNGSGDTYLYEDFPVQSLYISLVAQQDYREESLHVQDQEKDGFLQRIGSLLIRGQIWEIGIQAFMSRPLLGWGPENFTAAFNQTMPVEFYQTYAHSIAFDYAHNKIIDELVGKGLLGTIAYLAVWVSIFWTLIRLRRDQKIGIMAYAIGGALSGYFIQNMFGFDSAATLLQWSLLTAWVVRSEGHLSVGVSEESEGLSGDRRIRRLQLRRIVNKRGQEYQPLKLALIAAVAAIAFTSIFFMNWKPYSSVKVFTDSFTEGIEMEERIKYVEKSLAMTWALSSLPMKTEFDRISIEWAGITQDKKAQIGYTDKQKLVAYAFVEKQTTLFLEREPLNSQLLAGALPVLQAGARDKNDIAYLDNLVSQLETVAPNRLTTVERTATQALLRGDYQDSLDIVSNFLQKAPYFEEHFEIIVNIAQNALDEEEVVDKST
ncbi:MAG: hypothetical protein CL896_00455 [Dehalococcoidia bacterium]|nr:hypothetical protein [Dehalococcoidia bacterium]|tara:strand:- start:3614 stop:5902 length:2289 start_codon:yes stop_codon:yes gene_type:complete